MSNTLIASFMASIYKRAAWQIRATVVSITLVSAALIFTAVPWIIDVINGTQNKAVISLSDILAQVVIAILSLGVAESIICATDRSKRLESAAIALQQWDLNTDTPTVNYIRNHVRKLSPEERSQYFPDTNEPIYISSVNPSDLAADAILRSDIPRLWQAIPHFVTGLGLVFSFAMIAYLMIVLGITIKGGTKDAGALFNEIGNSVSAVAGKFLISGVAVFFSTLSLFILKAQYRLTSDSQQSITQETKRRVRSNDEYIQRKNDFHDATILQVTRNLLDQTTKLESIDVTIGNIGDHVLENVAMKLSQTFDQELRKVMAEQKTHLEALATAVEKNLQKLAEELKSANTSARTEVMNISGLGEVASKMKDLVGLIEESTRNASKASQSQLTDGITGTFQLIRDELTQNSASQREMITALRTTINDLSQTTKQTVNESQQSFAAVSGTVAHNINSLNNTISKFDAVAQNIDSIIATTSKTWMEGNKVAQTFKDTSERLQNISVSLDGTSKGISDFAARTKQITQDQSNLVTKQVNSITAITETFPEIEKATIEIATRFGEVGRGLSENMQEVLARFENISSALATPATAAAERVEESTDALCDALDRIGKKLGTQE